jgi:hypothetical protein
VLDNLDATEMTLVHGYAWRSKLKKQILYEWSQLIWPKRIWWTLMGKRPVA